MSTATPKWFGQAVTPEVLPRLQEILNLFDTRLDENYVFSCEQMDAFFHSPLYVDRCKNENRRFGFSGSTYKSDGTLEFLKACIQDMRVKYGIV